MRFQAEERFKQQVSTNCNDLMNALSYISNNLAGSDHNIKKLKDETDNSNKQLDNECTPQIDTNNEDHIDKENNEKNNENIEINNRSSNKTRFRMVVWSIVLFCPHYLVLKPTQFLWFLLTSPLILIEYGVKSKLHKNTKENSKTHDSAESVKPGSGGTLGKINENEEDDLSGGGELYLQRDYVKGSLSKTTSPSKSNQKYLNVKSGNKSDASSSAMNNVLGSKKMGRFLFPKKLIPKSVLNAQRRKILVMDLDETLIHSASRNTSHSNPSQGHMVEVKFAISGISTLYYVHKRPHCDLFLSKVSKWYDLVIFTASMKEYADPVIDWLESSFPGKFRKRLYRNNCTLRDGVGYIKDLSILCGSSSPISVTTSGGLGEVILIDNSPVSYALNVDNAIQVEGWISDPSDTDLLTLLPFLEALRYTTDVRDILALKNGEQAFIS